MRQTNVHISDMLNLNLKENVQQSKTRKSPIVSHMSMDRIRVSIIIIILKKQWRVIYDMQNYQKLYLLTSHSGTAL